MTQSKKTTAAASAKIASVVANKAAKTTYDAVESTRSSAENVVKIGSRAAKDLLASSASEAQKAQDKVLAMGRDGVAKFAKSADAMTRALCDSIESSRDNLEAAVECGNITAALAKDISGECFEYVNKSVSEALEISRDLFACRTINDVMEIQNRALRSAMDSAFAQGSRLSGLLFEYSSEALEPLSERVSQATEQLGKALKTA